MTTKGKPAPATKKLMTIMMTPDMETHLRLLGHYFPTRSAAIRNALKLLAMERAGEIEVIRKQK